MKLSPLIIGAAGIATLAATAAVTSQAARRAEREHPPTGAFLEIDGVRVHYTDDGSGTPIVLFHGNGVTSEDWKASGVLDAIAKQHRVIAFDRPGFGYSDRPRDTVWTPQTQASLAHRALVQLGVADAIVVGHSWGTLVALSLALDYPGDVARLVLISGYYFPTARLDVPFASAPAIPIAGDVLRYTLSPVLGRLTSPMLIAHLFAPAPVAPSFAGFPLSMSLRPSQLRANAADTALMIPSADALQQRYMELTLPVAIVTGSGDKVVSPKAQSVRLSDTLAHATLLSVEGAGHMVHYTAPEIVSNAILTPAQRSEPALR